MSRLVILAPLLLLSGLAVAQVDAPDCSLVTWQWTFNSLGQNACTVAAHLMATCSGGMFSIPPLESGASYTGPDVDDGNLCKCNTVVYSLLSACDACQQAPWITWSEYSSTCEKIMPPSAFPNPIPSGTRVPKWALIDVTLENNWDDNKSFAVGDSPELTPGTEMSPTHSSSPGAIAGGAVGGVATISVVGLAIFWLRRKRRSQARSAAPLVIGAPQPLLGEVRPSASDDGTYMSLSMPGMPTTPMKLYDSNDSDSTSFLGFQGAGQVDAVPVAPYSGNTLANMQTSRPQGSHGLPTV